MQRNNILFASMFVLLTAVIFTVFLRKRLCNRRRKGNSKLGHKKDAYINDLSGRVAHSL